MTKLLYVTWDGPDSSYLETLFFPLFAKLRSARGIATHVLQFAWDLGRLEQRSAAAARDLGLGYEAHEVPRRPIRAATALAVATGAARIVSVARQTGAEVIMPRSHIPGAMALLASPLVQRPMVWDSDGLMPDERADFGGWSRLGLNYRMFRRLERQLVEGSSLTLTRTRAAAQILQERSRAGRVLSIPNGKDPHQFKPSTAEKRAATRRALNIDPHTPLLVYAGSLGPQYRPQEMASVFVRILARRPDAHFLGLTQAPEAFSAALDAAGVPATRRTCKRVPANEIPELLAAADAGLSLREPSLSMRGVCPIKVAEYLLSGLPVLANAGIGDLDEQLAGPMAGHLAPDLSPASLDGLADFFVNKCLSADSREEARRRGLELFSLDECASRYGDAVASALAQSRS